MLKNISRFCLPLLLCFGILSGCGATEQPLADQSVPGTEEISDEQTPSASDADDIAGDTSASTEIASQEQEENAVFTGFISEIYPDTNSLYVRTDPELGFSYAYAVIVYLPADISAADQIKTSWVRITYSGEPEVVEPDSENGYEEITAIFEAEQIVDFLDFFVE